MSYLFTPNSINFDSTNIFHAGILYIFIMAFKKGNTCNIG